MAPCLSFPEVYPNTWALQSQGESPGRSRKRKFAGNQIAVPKRCQAGWRVSESIPAGRTPSSAQPGAGALQPVSGGVQDESPSPLAWPAGSQAFPSLPMQPSPTRWRCYFASAWVQCGRPKHGIRCSPAVAAASFGHGVCWCRGDLQWGGGVSLLLSSLYFFMPILLQRTEPARRFGLLSLWLFFFLPPLCISGQCLAVRVTDKCNSPVLAGALGHGWTPTGPQGLL